MRIIKFLDILLIILILVFSLFKLNILMLCGLIISVLFSVYLFARLFTKNKTYLFARNIIVLFCLSHVSQKNPLLNKGDVVMITIAVSAALFVLFLLTSVRKEFLKSLIVLSFLGLAIAASVDNILISTSKVFAYNCVNSGIAEITDKYVTNSGNIFDFLSVASIELKINDKSTEQVANINVDYFNHNEYNIGDKVEYTVYNGLWGEEYLVIKKPDSPS